MPYETSDPIGTVREGSKFDAHGTVTIGMMALSRVMGVAQTRIGVLAQEGLLPYKVVKQIQDRHSVRKVRAFDVHRCLWLWLGGLVLDARSLPVGHADPEVDLTWAFDALMDGIGRVDRRVPSARSLRLYLTAQNCEKRFDFLMDWGTKRMMNETVIERTAILRARARRAAEAEFAVGRVAVSDGSSRANPADTFLANRGGG